jgi:polygalacturonase
MNETTTRPAAGWGAPLALLVALALAVGPAAAPPAHGAPATTYDIVDFGAKADGSLSTAGVQKAIDACHDAGGGTVVVPPGEFVIGTVRLRSHVTLHLSAGAVLKGSSNLEDYASSGVSRGLFVAEDVANVSVTGFGTVDGNGTFFHDPDRPHVGLERDYDVRYTRQGEDFMHERFGFEDGPIAFERRPGMTFAFFHCENVTLRDLTIVDSPSWSVRFAYCDNVTVDNVKIFNNLLVPNSDGVHFTTSRNARVSNCDFRCGDDALIVATWQSGDPPDVSRYRHGNKAGVSENITVTNCLLKSRSAGIRIGYGRESVRNCTFDNIVIHDSNRGIGVFSREPGSDVDNILFSNILITNRLHKGHWWGKGEPIHVSTIPRFEGQGTGTIRNVRFRNVVAESETGIVVWGVEENPIRDLELSNVQLTIRESPIHEIYGGNFDLRPTSSFATSIFEHDVPAMFARQVDGLLIDHCRFGWKGELPAFFTNGFQGESIERLVIEGSHLKGTRGHEDLLLSDSPGAVLK